MYGYLSNEPENFVDDPKKLYRLRRREAQAKKLEFEDQERPGGRWMTAPQ
jgi:hypothetical protein